MSGGGFVSSYNDPDLNWFWRLIESSTGVNFPAEARRRKARKERESGSKGAGK